MKIWVFVLILKYHENRNIDLSQFCRSLNLNWVMTRTIFCSNPMDHVYSRRVTHIESLCTLNITLISSIEDWEVVLSSKTEFITILTVYRIEYHPNVVWLGLETIELGSKWMKYFHFMVGHTDHLCVSYHIPRFVIDPEEVYIPIRVKQLCNNQCLK